MKQGLAICFLLMLCHLLSGQGMKTYSVSGQITDEDGRALEYASVVIKSLPDTLLVAGAMADDKGRFVIEKIRPGEYLLEIGFVGYRTAVMPLTLEDKAPDLSVPIVLQSSAISLAGGQVTAVKNERQSTVEKTKVNVSRNLSSVSGNITEMLKNQANITLDGDGSLYLRGNRNILLLIDGVPTTVANLNSIPASGVDNIEIITNPDVKYDAEGTGGIINIVTKRDRMEGFSGAASLNYGIYDNVNGGLNLRYSKGIWDMGLDYGGKYDNSLVSSSLLRELHEQQTKVEQWIDARQTNSTHTAGLNFAVRPSPKDLIALNVKFMAPEIHNLQTVTGKQTVSDLSESVFNRQNDITFARKSIEGALSYKRFFEKGRHELSFNASFSRTRGSRPAKYQIDNELVQQSDGGGTPTNFTVQADYLKSVSKSGKIEAGLKAFSRWNNFRYSFYDWEPLSGAWVLNPAYSNNLQHHEYIYSAYLMYSDAFWGKFKYKVGLRAEYNTTELKQESLNERIFREYFFPFPFVQASYAFDRSNNLALSVNRRITRPTYPQLNPFVYIIDNMTYETGNKNLEPEVLDKVELYYALNREKLQLNANVYYTHTKNFITQVSNLSEADRLLLSYVNGNRQHRVGSDIDMTFKFCRYFWLTPSVSLFYTKSDGFYEGIDLAAECFAWTGNLKMIGRPEKKTEIQLLLNYESPVKLPQFNLDRIYYTDISVRRTFFDDRLSVSLTLTDIFNTRKWINYTDNQIYSLYNNSKDETRILWIGLTYNFNSFKSDKSRKGTAGGGDRKIVRLGAID